MVRSLLSALVAVLHFLALPFQAPTYPYGVQQALRSVLVVTATLTRDEEEVGHTVCTGEVIAQDRVLTAAHCLGKDMQVGLSLEILQPAEILKGDDYFDLALLKAKTDSLPPIAMTDAVPMICATDPNPCLVGLGYGLRHMEVLTARLMNVNVVAPWEDDPQSIVGLLVDRQWVHGMSGGPVLDQSGAMVGMIQQAFEGMGWGTTMQVIRVFLLGTH